MADTKIVTLEVQSNLEQSAKSVGSLKSQLREAQAEVAALSDKFGATSREAIEAAKRAGELKDKIGDAKALTDAFNPDAKFTALSSSLTGVAGGFSAVTGAMGLLGSESKDVELAILKVQSAMAVASGLQQLGESVDAFKQMKAVALDAFQSIKAAIGSTGIGLFLVALGTIVTYWDEISRAIGGATEEQKAYQSTQEEVTKSLAKVEENLISVKIALDQAKKGTISKKDALKLYNEKLGEALGKTDSLAVAEQRLAQNTDSYIKSQMAKAQAQIFLAKAADAAAKAASGEAAELDWWDKAKVAIAQYGSAAAGATTAAELAIKNIAKNQKEITFYTDLATKEYKKAAEEENKINADAINTRYEAQHKAVKIHTETEKEKLDALKKLNEEYEKDLAKQPVENPDLTEVQKLDASNQAKRDLIKSNNEQILDLQRQFELQNAQITYDSEEAQKQRRQEAFNQKIQDFQNVSNAIGSIAKSGEDVLEGLQSVGIARGKEGQAAMKALALVQIGVDSAVAFSKMMQGTEASAAGAAASAGPAAPAVYLATKIAFYASGTATILANIARAKNLLSSGGNASGGGGAAPNAPAVPAAPSFNVVGNGGANQIAQVMSDKGMPPIKTYVTAGDVTTQQGLNRNIVSNATLG